MLSHLVPTSAGNGQGGRICPSIKQIQGCIENLEVLAMQPWHQPELPSRSNRFLSDPTLLFRMEADG